MPHSGIGAQNRQIFGSKAQANMEVTLRSDMSKLCREVAFATSYAGAKGDDERIGATVADQAQLASFAVECFDEAAGMLKRVVAGKATDEGMLKLKLSLSPSFDPQHAQLMQAAFDDMLRQGVIARWYAIANKTEATAHAERATALMQQLAAYAFLKNKPTRPTYG